MKIKKQDIDNIIKLLKWELEEGDTENEIILKESNLKFKWELISRDQTSDLLEHLNKLIDKNTPEIIIRKIRGKWIVIVPPRKGRRGNERLAKKV